MEEVDIPAVDTLAEGMEDTVVTAEDMAEAFMWEEGDTAAVIMLAVARTSAVVMPESLMGPSVTAV